MYVHDSLHYNILNDIVITDAESLWIEVINRNNKFIIGTIYRPPSSNSDIFIDSLEQILYHRVQGYAGCFLVGDFNIDVSKPCEATADKLLSVLSCLHFEQTIITPTRITGASETTIDHLYTNMAHLNITSGTLLAHISDHLPTFAFFHSMTMHSASKANGPFRNYSKFKLDSFRHDLQDETWHEVLNCKDVNEAMTKFTNTFLNICNTHAPLKNINKVKKGVKNKPWITAAIRKSIRKKHNLFKKVVRSKFEENILQKFKRYRNVLTNILRKAKKKYYSDLFNIHYNDMKETWRVVNDLLGKKKNSNSSIPTKIKSFCNGTSVIHTEIPDIVDVFNNHFVNIGEKLAKNIQANGNGCFRDFMGDYVPHCFFLKPTSVGEVEDIISSLNVHKASGWDKIDAKLLKYAMPYVSKPLCNIVNLSFSTGCFPDSLKIAKVIPLFKKGDPEETGNYRPISILPIISKVFEKIMCKRVVNFVEKHDLLFQHQYGFREKYSCKLSLISLVQHLLDELDKGKSTTGIFIDFSKAFDTVNHNILFSKLDHQGIRGVALDWFKSYLDSRCQFVLVI
ncbi:uncharacterized protein LOC144438132 [Glandiceps talaboti]